MSYDPPNPFHSGHGGSPSQPYTLHYQPRKYHSDPPSPDFGAPGPFPPQSTERAFYNSNPFSSQSAGNLLSGQISYATIPAHEQTVGQAYQPQHVPGFRMDGFLPALQDAQSSYVNQQSPASEGEDSDGLFSSPIPPIQFPPHEETEAYLRRTLKIMHPRPVNLGALPDEPFSGKAPKISDLIKLAIWGSKHKRLPLNQIYAEIENRYPSWKAARDKPWQRSIRHNLSLKAIFVHQERPVSHPGKGHYWMLDYRLGEGNKRNRKRVSGGAKYSGMSDDSDSERLVPDDGPHGGSNVVNPIAHVPSGLTSSMPGPGGFYRSEDDLSVAPPTLGMRHPIESSNLRPGPPPSVGPNMRWNFPSASFPGDMSGRSSGNLYSSSGGHPIVGQHTMHHAPTESPYFGGPGYVSVPSNPTTAVHALPPTRPRRAHSDTFTEQDAAEDGRASRRHRIS